MLRIAMLLALVLVAPLARAGPREIIPLTLPDVDSMPHPGICSDGQVTVEGDCKGGLREAYEYVARVVHDTFDAARNLLALDPL